MPNLDRFNDDAFRYQDQRERRGREDHDSVHDVKRCAVCERLIIRGHLCTSCEQEEGNEDES